MNHAALHGMAAPVLGAARLAALRRVPSPEHRASTAKPRAACWREAASPRRPLNTKLRGSLEPPGSPAPLVPLQSQLRSRGGRATL